MAKNQSKDMTVGNPFQIILFFAIPVLIGNVFQQLYSMVDTIIEGQSLGTEALAAVGSTGSLNFLVNGFSTGIAGGFAVLPAQFFGAKDEKRLKKSVGQAILLCLFFTVLLTALSVIFTRPVLVLMKTPENIIGMADVYIKTIFWGICATILYNMCSCVIRALGDSKTPLYLLIFSSILNIVMDLWMVAGLGLGVFGAALATLIAQGISAVFSLLIFLYRMRRYQSPFQWFDGRKLRSMLRIAVPSVLQQSTVSIGMMIVQAVVNPFGTQALAGYAATMRVENVFSLIFVSIGNAVSPYVSQNLGAGKTERIKKGYHAALVLDVCFAAVAFFVIETLHTQISSLFLGKDGTALAYQVSGDYMRWLGYFFIFMGIKMATDGVLRGLGIMRPFLIANMVNLAIRLSVALICAPRFGIDFVWLAVPAGWLANFLVSYAALRKSWPGEKVEPSRIFS